MDNAPTHPPTRSHNGGSPPKGPRRMTRSRRLAPAIVRDRLTTAAGRLRDDGEPDLADAVDAVLAPRGWELLKKPVVATAAQPNMALWMNKAIKRALEAKARAEAKENVAGTDEKPADAASILAAVVEEGLEKFIDGEFIPSKPVRSARGSATAKENLNIRPSKRLRDAADAMCPALSQELGWEVTPGKVAMAWLYSEYGITEDDQIGVTVPEAPAEAE